MLLPSQAPKTAARAVRSRWVVVFGFFPPFFADFRVYDFIVRQRQGDVFRYWCHTPRLTLMLNFDMPPEVVGTAKVQLKELPSSQLFNAADAEIIFQSSDKVLFYIHKKNIETQAGGFPPSEFDTCGEIVSLTEDSPTLELLFSFIYPRRHPDLESTPFDTLAKVAEAAEKYEVYSAMDICRIRMRQTLPEHADEIMVYAAKHEYRDILLVAAPSLLDEPLEEILLRLPENMIIPWVRYYETWSRIFLQTILSSWATRNKKGPGDQGYCCESCSGGGTSVVRRCISCGTDADSVVGRILNMLEGKKTLKGALFPQDIGTCTHMSLDTLHANVMREREQMPAFITFL